MASNAEAFLAARSHLRLNPMAMMRLSFEREAGDGPGNALVAVMRCVTCDEGFVWNAQANWWTCLSCGIELTPNEVAEFMAAAKNALKVLNTDVGTKRGGRCHWLLRLLGHPRAGR